MKLTHGIFYSNDLSVASSFYENVLGFKKAFGDDRFVAYTIGDALLGIKLRKEEREVPGHQTVIITIEDIDAWYESLIEKGVQILKPMTDDPRGKNFSLLDSDNNKVEFVAYN